MWACGGKEAMGQVFIDVQGESKVFVHLVITVQKFTSNVQSVPRQSPNVQLNLTAWHPTARARGTRDKLTPSVIPNSNYVIMVSD
jgi:hypothetical protein